MSDDLLAGPRGRRLCLELARDADPRVRDSLFTLEYNADVAAGASIVHFGWTDDGGTFESRGPMDTTASTGDLAALIRSLPPVELTAPVIDEALRRSVDGARYWQEPDGADIVAADPDVRAALTAIAAQVTVHPDGGWWTRDRTARQWAVEFDPAGDLSPFTLPADAAARWSDATRAEEERATWERPADPAANVSGYWSGRPRTRSDPGTGPDLVAPDSDIVTRFGCVMPSPSESAASLRIRCPRGSAGSRPTRRR